MKLSHMHEDRTGIPKPFPFPSVGKTLADYLNSNRIYPSANMGGGNSEDIRAIYAADASIIQNTRREMAAGRRYFDIELKMRGNESWRRFTDRPISLTKNGPFKIVRHEPVEYEPIPRVPEPDNPLDNIKDEYGGERDFAMFAAVAEGANKFEGQFAWYNEDIIGVNDFPHKQIWPQRGLCWQEGKLPKFPRRYSSLRVRREG